MNHLRVSAFLEDNNRPESLYLQRIGGKTKAHVRIKADRDRSMGDNFSMRPPFILIFSKLKRGTLLPIGGIENVY